MGFRAIFDLEIAFLRVYRQFRFIFLKYLVSSFFGSTNMNFKWVYLDKNALFLGDLGFLGRLVVSVVTILVKYRSFNSSFQYEEFDI